MRGAASKRRRQQRRGRTRHGRQRSSARAAPRYGAPPHLPAGHGTLAGPGKCAACGMDRHRTSSGAAAPALGGCATAPPPSAPPMGAPAPGPGHPCAAPMGAPPCAGPSCAGPPCAGPSGRPPAGGTATPAARCAAPPSCPCSHWPLGAAAPGPGACATGGRAWLGSARCTRGQWCAVSTAQSLEQGPRVGARRPARHSTAPRAPTGARARDGWPSSRSCSAQPSTSCRWLASTWAATPQPGMACAPQPMGHGYNRSLTGRGAGARGAHAEARGGGCFCGAGGGGGARAGWRCMAGRHVTLPGAWVGRWGAWDAQRGPVCCPCGSTGRRRLAGGAGAAVVVGMPLKL